MNNFDYLELSLLKFIKLLLISKNQQLRFMKLNGSFEKSAGKSENLKDYF